MIGTVQDGHWLGRKCGIEIQGICWSYLIQKTLQVGDASKVEFWDNFTAGFGICRAQVPSTLFCHFQGVSHKRYGKRQKSLFGAQSTHESFAVRRNATPSVAMEYTPTSVLALCSLQRGYTQFATCVLYHLSSFHKTNG